MKGDASIRGRRERLSHPVCDAMQRARRDARAASECHTVAVSVCCVEASDVQLYAHCAQVLVAMLQLLDGLVGVGQLDVHWVQAGADPRGAPVVAA